MAVLYRHIRLDTNQPFYIGIGKTEKRAYTTKSRNKHWHNIAKNGYKVQIMLDDLSWDEACEKEREFIALYGRSEFGGLLCNLTDGGEGTIGRVYSAEHRAKISEGNKGKTHSAETKQKMSEARKGRKPNLNKTLSAETKAKISATHKGKPKSAETRAKMSEWHKGKIMSAEHRAKMSAANKGKPKPPISAETRAKLSEAAKLDWEKRKKKLFMACDANNRAS